MCRASLRNASQKGGKELCTSYLNLVTSKRCWRLLVRVDWWGWDSAETLLPLTLPHEGENEEHFAWIIFRFIFPLIKHVKTRLLTCIHIRWIYLAYKTWFKHQEYSKLSAFKQSLSAYQDQFCVWFVSLDCGLLENFFLSHFLRKKRFYLSFSC